MKRKIFSLIAALCAAILITSTVFAGAIKLSGVTFRLGSLIAEGTLSGLGNQDVRVLLEASGFPEVTCTNHGGNQAPGQNPPKVSASGEQQLFGFDLTRKNGKSPFGVETDDPLVVDPIVYGCPNANWTATIDFIHWTEATITILDLNTQAILRIQRYSCVTTLNSVTCSPLK
jgi:hypothetical protein